MTQTRTKFMLCFYYLLIPFSVLAAYMQYVSRNWFMFAAMVAFVIINTICLNIWSKRWRQGL